LADEAIAVTSKLFLGVMFACCTMGCNRDKSGRDVDADIRRLVNQTVAADGTLIREARISRTPSGVEAGWEIASQLSEQDYLTALKKNLGSEYQVGKQTQSELVLGRLLPGDAYELHIAGFDESGKQRVLSFHFIARPD
jgi:hypothetical protein